jgi:drug/metabolite transporter (DMT)-like permease
MTISAGEPHSSSARLPQSHMLLGIVALLSMGTLWGLSFALAKLATQMGAHPIGLVLWETLGSGMLLLIVCMLRGRYPRVQGRYVLYYLVAGLLGVAVPGSILFWIAPHLPVAILTLMIPMTPVLTYAMALVARLERFEAGKAVGVALGLLAIAFVVLPGGNSLTPNMAGWVLLGPAASALYALQNLYIARFSPPSADALSQTTGMLLAAGLAMTPLAAAINGFVAPAVPPTAVTLCAAAMLVINAAMMLIFVWTIRDIGPVFASQAANVIVFAGILWGWVIFSETLSSRVWAGTLAMLAGVALVTLRGARRQPAL